MSFLRYCLGVRLVYQEEVGDFHLPSQGTTSLAVDEYASFLTTFAHFQINVRAKKGKKSARKREMYLSSCFYR